MSLHCQHIFFSGKVQGVFFRATSQNIARELCLTGWVRNLPDGRVEMQVQGGEQALDKMVERLDEGFKIKKTDRKDVDCSDGFTDFMIIR